MCLKQAAEPYAGQAFQSMGVATSIPEKRRAGRVGIVDVARRLHMGNTGGLFLEEPGVSGEIGDKRGQNGPINRGDGLPELKQGGAEIRPPSSRDWRAVQLA